MKIERHTAELVLRVKYFRSRFFDETTSEQRIPLPLTRRLDGQSDLLLQAQEAPDDTYAFGYTLGVNFSATIEGVGQRNGCAEPELLPGLIYIDGDVFEAKQALQDHPDDKPLHSLVSQTKPSHVIRDMFGEWRLFRPDLDHCITRRP